MDIRAAARQIDQFGGSAGDDDFRTARQNVSSFGGWIVTLPVHNEMLHLCVSMRRLGEQLKVVGP
jgi:hypothetical protein